MHIAEMGQSNNGQDFSLLADTIEKRAALKEHLIREFNLSNEELKLISDYLNRRKLEVADKENFGIVYAITRYCNLACRHCGVNAKLMNSKSFERNFETSNEQVHLIIDKIKDFSLAANIVPFLMFGGGEPTLRPDFKDILRYAAGQLGSNNIGFCTNGTLWKTADLLEIENFVDVIEVSIDGPTTYHNAWRNPRKKAGVIEPFLTSMDLILSSTKYDNLRKKIEIASTITKSNMDLLPEFARNLRDSGIKTYSVHRAMPVGRMARRLEDIPNSNEYMRFFITMVRLKNEDWSFGFHLHHSLESIYSTLFLGEDIHQSRLPMGSLRHSIGIDWKGFIYFDPWSLIPPYDGLTAGNILENGVNLDSLLSDSSNILHLTSEIVKKNVRCKRCGMTCTGGMRLNAISHHIQLRQGKLGQRVSDSDIVAGLSQIDPSCPLYKYST